MPPPRATSASTCIRPRAISPSRVTSKRMLNYNIKGTGLDISDELRGYAEKKLQHAEKFLRNDPSARADIELEHQALRDGGHYRAEFTVSFSGAVYRAESWGTSCHEAIDLAAGELVNELGRNKKKRLHLLRRSAAKVKDYLRGWPRR